MSVLHKLESSPTNNKFKNKKRKIDLIVIQITPGGKLRNSMPCDLCVSHMIQMQKRGNFKIRKIYWSTGQGSEIIGLSFSNFLKLPRYRTKARQSKIKK